MNRLHEWDDESITAAIAPQTCGGCGGRTDRVRLALEAVLSCTGDFLGIRTVATTPCCGGRRTAQFPADELAWLLEHLKGSPDCPHREK